jgi:hypothetical protein
MSTARLGRPHRVRPRLSDSPRPAPMTDSRSLPVMVATRVTSSRGCLLPIWPFRYVCARLRAANVHQARGSIYEPEASSIALRRSFMSRIKWRGSVGDRSKPIARSR